MAYRLYLFDFDYTLVNSEKGILGCFHLTNQALGYPDCDDDTMRRTIGLPMVQAVFRAVPGIPEEKIRPYLNQYRQFANQIMTANTFFFPETLPALRILRERGAKIGVISSKTHHRIQEKFDLDGAHDLLDFVVGSDDVTAAKPDPEGIRIALRHFDVKPQEVLYTGDSRVDAGAAENAGVAFAAVTTGVTSKEQLLAYPHQAILTSLAGIPYVA